MTDVTRANFAGVVSEISEKIRSCAFIAIDTEFTALTAGPQCVTR